MNSLNISQIYRKNNEKLIFISCILIILTYIFVSPQFLNTLISYTTSGGSFVEKFHIATYFVIFAAILLVNKFKFSESKFYILQLIVIVLFVAYIAVIGNFNYLSVFVDIFLSPMMFVFILTKLTDDDLSKAFNFMISLVALNIFLVTIEFARQQALLPYEQELAHFRPAGFLGHPIAAGVSCCIAMLGASYTIRSAVVRRLVSLILLTQIAFCGVRGPLALGLVIFLHDILFPRSKNGTSYSKFFDLAVISVVVLAGMFVFSLGVFDRIIDRGVWDDSAASRVDIFQLFSFMSTDEFWYGTTYERALMYAQALSYRRIENSFVVSVYQAGIIFACLAAIWLVLSILNSLRSSYLFSFLFVVMSFTTLYFGVKNTVTYSFFFLALVIKNSDISSPSKPAIDPNFKR